MFRYTVDVTGMTCQHCVSHVTEELSACAGVQNVSVALEPAGLSQITIDADAPLTDEVITQAIDEAGDYPVQAIRQA
ncbi:heavy-metal-associated domain-containing protein [Trueperella sp. LYQ143]|uniref:heavy-metal-associated domain-containing protein n=1 Tax=Trueperella sp. LYQ143 TaxID=3391059 RepID=UPI0039838833